MARVVDTTTDQVQIKARGQVQLSGDYVFQLQIPDEVQDLSKNQSLTTRVTRSDLAVSTDTVEVSFLVHLPDSGHFGFAVDYSFAPDSTVSETGAPVLTLGSVPIYVTMERGAITHYELYPDTTYVGPAKHAVIPSRADLIAGAAIHTITVDIRGKVFYETSFPRIVGSHPTASPPPDLTYGVPGIEVDLDWIASNAPRHLEKPPGYPAMTVVTDEDGEYHFDFKFLSEVPASFYTNRVRVVAKRENDATYDGTLGRGALLGGTGYVRVPSRDNTIQAANINIKVEKEPGAILRHLHRARQFTIDEMGYTPVGDEGQVEFYYFSYGPGIAHFCFGASRHEPKGIIDADCNAERVGGPAPADRIIWDGFPPDAASAYHEYGHFVEFDKVGYLPPGEVLRRAFFGPSDHNFAWVEGWANFFGAACHMHWYEEDPPDIPDPIIGRYFPQGDLGLRQFLDVALRNLSATDGRISEGAVACFLYSLWDDIGLRAPRDPVEPDYEGDNDDLALEGDLLLRLLPRRWSREPKGPLRAGTNVESYRDALYLALDSDQDASVKALYNQIIRGTGRAKPATATSLGVSGNYSSRTLSWKDNTAPSKTMKWTGPEDRVLLNMRMTPETRNNEQGFRVFRRSLSRPQEWDGTLTGYRQVGTVGADVTTWRNDDDLEGGVYYSYIVTAYNASGNSLPRDEVTRVMITPRGRKPVAIEEPAITAAPNPFNSSVVLRVVIDRDGPVQLTVHNTTGQTVAVLEKGVLQAGPHVRYWRPDPSIASGIYLYRMEANGRVRLGKLALIR